MDWCSGWESSFTVSEGTCSGWKAYINTHIVGRFLFYGEIEMQCIWVQRIVLDIKMISCTLIKPHIGEENEKWKKTKNKSLIHAWTSTVKKLWLREKCISFPYSNLTAEEPRVKLKQAKQYETVNTNKLTFDTTTQRWILNYHGIFCVHVCACLLSCLHVVETIFRVIHYKQPKQIESEDLKYQVHQSDICIRLSL